MKAPGRARRGRLALLVLPLFCAALLWPASSQAFVACSMSGTDLFVSSTSADDSVSFERSGAQIAVVAGYDPEILVPCSGGTPTVDNTDSVTLQQAAGRGYGEVGIDLGQGTFAPGATPEADGTSEIEFNVQMFSGEGFFFIEGTGAPEVIQLGTTASRSTGINLNAGAESASPDSDIDLSGAEVAFVYADGGPDQITGQGGPAFIAPAATALIAIGGDGRDLLVGPPLGALMSGGGGRDLVLGSSRSDYLSGGSAKDTIKGGKGRDVVFAADGKRDRIRCGPSKDRLAADFKDKPKGCERIRRQRIRKRRGRPLPDEIGIFAATASASGDSRNAWRRLYDSLP